MTSPRSHSARSAATPPAPALADWIELAVTSEVPGFSATVQEVTSLASSSGSSAQDLASAIGRDAALASKLLKMANSPLFNLQDRSIKTINNAVVLLGFDAVRDLALSLSIIDNAIRSPEHAPLVDSLLRAFHCAGQARAIAIQRKDTAPEEVFLAGLLTRLGELVFWSSGTPAVSQLAELWQGSAPNEALQQEALGFTLPQLTSQLVQQWHLSELLHTAVIPAAAPTEDQRVAGVQIAHDVAGAASAENWLRVPTLISGLDERLRRLISRRADLLKMEPQDSLDQIKAQADNVSQIARRFGVSSAAPEPPDRTVAADTARRPGTASVASAATAAGDPARPAANDEPAPATGVPDATRQLSALSAMASAMQGPITLDELLILALDGLVAGAGFSRAFFALLTPDRRSLQLKHRRGPLTDLPPTIVLADNPVISTAMAGTGPSLQATSFSITADSSWHTPSLCLLHPVLTGGSRIGLLYADCAPADCPISPEATMAMALFAQQIAMGMGAIARR